jgi:acyl carrier protein
MSEADRIHKVVLDSIEAVNRTPRAQLSVATKLVSDLGMESIDILDLHFEIEKRLNININLVDVFQRRSAQSARSVQFDLAIGEIEAYVKELVAR